ncbi:hypothetical protein RB8448 [Rhodopirellula baltica SH 1]|uniref:Uncharacterized protein n=1 Tax=Rhodopirellula baltica (strain DSM 10527 / NCIMB 13988 / SH1) TaxID=243090 RepID=Q7UFN8_RHOBA|nr:hypothetical protein RB8448 [Rhodopirellula baltica SH 1]
MIVHFGGADARDKPVRFPTLDRFPRSKTQVIRDHRNTDSTSRTFGVFASAMDNSHSRAPVLYTNQPCLACHSACHVAANMKWVHGSRSNPRGRERFVSRSTHWFDVHEHGLHAPGLHAFRFPSSVCSRHFEC